MKKNVYLNLIYISSIHIIFIERILNNKKRKIIFVKKK